MAPQNRRKFERYPCFDKATIMRQGEGGRTMQSALYLCNISEGGVSGTYFGKDIPLHHDKVVLVSNENNAKYARLAWSCETIESVYMLGFEFMNDNEHHKQHSNEAYNDTTSFSTV